MIRAKTMGQSFRRSIGVGDCESRDWSFWFMIAIVLGFVASIVVVIGCASANTQPLYLFRVSSDDLISAVANTTTIPSSQLSIDGLPSYWYWGMTGLCAVFTQAGHDTISCQSGFTPVLGLHDIVSFAVSAKLGYKSSELEQHISPWTSALSQLSTDLVSSSQAETFYKVAVICAVVSNVLAFILFPLAILSLSVLRDRLPRWALYLIAFLDTLALTAAGVLIIFAMKQGPRALIAHSGIPQASINDFVGSALYVLFAGALFKLVSIELFLILVFATIFSPVFIVIFSLSCLCNRRGSKEREEDTYPICEYPIDAKA